ncbi:hypothetical protein [Methylobacterium crusticola]|nr:hypothetical protein [Methylobacterium crusticola]
MPPLAAGTEERAAIMAFVGGMSRDEVEACAGVPAAPTVLDPLPAGDGLGLWRAGVARLSPHAPQCPDYHEGEWRQVYARAMAFLDAFGAQAEALGWTTPELWGVHPMLGTVRVDHCGALALVVGGPVVVITRDAIHHDRHTFRRRPHAPRGIPLWEFG